MNGHTVHVADGGSKTTANSQIPAQGGGEVHPRSRNLRRPRPTRLARKQSAAARRQPALDDEMKLGVAQPNFARKPSDAWEKFRMRKVGRGRRPSRRLLLVGRPESRHASPGPPGMRRRVALGKWSESVDFGAPARRFGGDLPARRRDVCRSRRRVRPAGGSGRAWGAPSVREGLGRTVVDAVGCQHERIQQ